MHFVEIFPSNYVGASIQINLDLITHIVYEKENSYFSRYFSINLAGGKCMDFFEYEPKEKLQFLIEDFDKVYNNLLSAIRLAQKDVQFHAILDLRV
ncbi:MAG: hypothetical protein ULS35scaffold63_5 [Phage 33_17]|nr:MAG: hypothetical protein ULS35scaffold63_5 [Phage 33_17]